MTLYQIVTDLLKRLSVSSLHNSSNKQCLWGALDPEPPGLACTSALMLLSLSFPFPALSYTARLPPLTSP